MSGTQHRHDSSVEPTARAVRDDVDLDETVWFGNGVAYHRDAEWGPACPDVIGTADEHTLDEAAEEELRPCKDCNPVDYRPLVADGGLKGVEDLDAHPHANELEKALDYVIEARTRSADLEIGRVPVARLALGEKGTRLAFYAKSEAERDVVLEDARRHLETVVDEVDTTIVTEPVRRALQLFIAFEGVGRDEA